MRVHNKILFFLILFFFSCSNVKLIYEKELNLNDKRSNLLMEKFELNDKKTILYFIGNFNNNDVKVLSNKTIILDKNLKSIEQLGFADSCIVENGINILITIDSEKDILLPAEKLKLYKFVYLKKQDKKYTVIYTNKAYSFK